MPKVSKETASETIALDGLEVRLELVEFSPTDTLARTIPVVLENLRAAELAARSRG